MGMVDYNKKEIDELLKFLSRTQVEMEKITEEVLSDTTKVCLTEVKKNTPVGQYKDKQGGNLKKNWSRTRIWKEGIGHKQLVYNNTEYASFVEVGHRIVNRKGETVGWCKGRFMLQKAIFKSELYMIKKLKQKIKELEEKNNER